MKISLDVNKLSLTIDKSQFHNFKSPQHSSPKSISVTIGKLTIKHTCYVKFLGVLLDENRSWKYHLTKLSKKLARTCGEVFKVTHFLSVDILVYLYNSLFSPFLHYGILVWGLTYETHISALCIKVNKRGVAISGGGGKSSKVNVYGVGCYKWMWREDTNICIG